jgi:hypothetical protein
LLPTGFRDRVKSGIAAARTKGKTLGHSHIIVDVVQIARLRTSVHRQVTIKENGIDVIFEDLTPAKKALDNARLTYQQKEIELCDLANNLNSIIITAVRGGKRRLLVGMVWHALMGNFSVSTPAYSESVRLFLTCNFTCNDSVLAIFTRTKPLFSSF